MGKYRTRKNNFFKKSFKNIRRTSALVLPKVERGLDKVGTFVTDAAIKSGPIVKKGLVNTFNALKNTSRYAVNRVKKTIRRRRNKKSSRK
jgi:hypothetical protein